MQGKISLWYTKTCEINVFAEVTLGLRMISSGFQKSVTVCARFTYLPFFSRFF